MIRKILLYLASCFAAFFLMALPVCAASYTRYFPSSMSPAVGRINSASTVWATARAGSGLTLVVNNSISTSADFNNPTYTITRSFLTFNTVDIPSTAVITSVRLCINNASTLITGSPTVYLVTSTRADPLNLSTADWSNISSVSLATLPITPTASYFKLCTTFSAYGLTSINKGGYTTFAFRETRDLNNVAPSPSPTTNRMEHLNISAADRDLRPTLEIVYDYDIPQYELASSTSSTIMETINFDFFMGLMSFVAGFGIMWLIL